MNTEIEKQLQDIKIIKPLKPGGQKDVYIVESTKYGKCILKLIRASKIERVIREIEIITKYNISNVPRMYENGYVEINQNKYLYIIEEFIEGESLFERLLERKRLSLKESYTLLETLLEIEVELEENKVIHRDIKPDNILISNDGKFYLIDFGIARALEMQSLTYTEVKVGPHTPGYAAPELFQYDKGKIGTSSDLFSIGVVIYECLFGKNPFVSGVEKQVQEIWYKTITILPENIKIEGDTQQQFMGLIETLMMKQISKRPPSAKKALEWLHSIKETLVFGEE